MLLAALRTLFRGRPGTAQADADAAAAVKTAIEAGKQKSLAGDHSAAAAAFQRALAAAPSNAEAHFRLGLALRDQQRLDDAAASYRRAIELQPAYVEAHNNLGSVLQMLEQSDAALTAYRRAVALGPTFAQPYLNLGRLYALAGDTLNAAATFEAAIARGIDVDSFRHLLSALKGETTIRAPDAYTRSLFDNFAGDFDRRLINELGYEVPQTLVKQIKTLAPQADLRVLDLGCGTGLCGAAFGGGCSQLTGIDLSGLMLEKARARDLYTELVQSSIETWLEQAPPAAYDIVLAADVWIYCGDLAPLFASIARRLVSGGLYAFSVEIASGESFVLQASGRYAHPVAYIRSLYAGSDLTEVDGFPHHIRGNVNGYIFILRKSCEPRATSNSGAMP